MNFAKKIVCVLLLTVVLVGCGSSKDLSNAEKLLFETNMKNSFTNLRDRADGFVSVKVDFDVAQTETSWTGDFLMAANYALEDEVTRSRSVALDVNLNLVEAEKPAIEFASKLVVKESMLYAMLEKVVAEGLLPIDPAMFTGKWFGLPITDDLKDNPLVGDVLTNKLVKEETEEMIALKNLYYETAFVKNVTSQGKAKIRGKNLNKYLVEYDGLAIYNYLIKSAELTDYSSAEFELSELEENRLFFEKLVLNSAVYMNNDDEMIMFNPTLKITPEMLASLTESDRAELQDLQALTIKLELVFDDLTKGFQFEVPAEVINLEEMLGGMMGGNL